MPSAAALGKRKRRPAQNVKEDDTGATTLDDAQAIFRKHFEAQFAPIQSEESNAADKTAASGNETRAGVASEENNSDGDGIEDMRSDSESGEDDEWGGLSAEDDSDGTPVLWTARAPLCVLKIQLTNIFHKDDDSDPEQDGAATEPATVEVIDHSKPLPNATAAQGATMSKREMRAYLSSRPPDTTSSSSAISKIKQVAGDDANEDPQNEDSRTLLANDLELQRLINESHILSASNPFHHGTGKGANAAATFAEGRTRKLTTDLRLQKLGSKDSILTQRKMPMGMRQGINTARGAREEKRRREAKENGIVLEKAAPEPKRKKKGRSDVAVDMPGMGRFSGGELRLNKREVREIEMEGKRMDFGGKRRRRRR